MSNDNSIDPRLSLAKAQLQYLDTLFQQYLCETYMDKKLSGGISPLSEENSKDESLILQQLKELALSVKVTPHLGVGRRRLETSKSTEVEQIANSIIGLQTGVSSGIEPIINVLKSRDNGLY